MISGSSEQLLEQHQNEQRRLKLKELAPKKKNGKQKRTWRERVQFYTTSTLAFFSVTAGASLLFLVPLYVDPAISTLVSDFIDSPTWCTTTRREDVGGLLNCSWSSCREGCTSDLYKCTHIYVTYIESNFTFMPNISTMMLANMTELEHSEEAMLLVNIKGCGYPPSVTCKNFSETYGIEGAIYPCHYSRVNKTVVLATYDHNDQVSTIINFFVVPFIITVISSIALCVMHCDCRCKKERNNRRRPPHRRRPRIENLRLVKFKFITILKYYGFANN